MRKMFIALAAIVALSGCTTTEKDVVGGTLIGAAAGGIIGGGEGALIGAGAGALGGVLVRNLRNGNCQYRNSRGQIYTARCR